MFEDHSHRLGQARAEAENRYTDADRAQIARAGEAANALFAPKRETAPPAKSAPPEPEKSSGQGPRKPRILRALLQQPAQVERPAKPTERKSKGRPAPAEQPKGPKVPTSKLPRIRTWLKCGMTVRQVAQVYGVPATDITRLLQRMR